MRGTNVLQECSAVRSCAGVPRLRGFSLVELMITVAIIGILAAVAYPSYLDYVRRGNRSAAQTFMMAIASRQEQYILTNRSYTTDITRLGLVAPPETTGKYSFTITGTGTPPNVSDYLITATPEGSQAVSGKFEELTLGSNGVKAPAAEWQR
jgi:type IV pilus assembly protein PilE